MNNNNETVETQNEFVSISINNWNKIQDALSAALPYVSDVLDNPEQLKAFKKGVVKKHLQLIQDAITVQTL